MFETIVNAFKTKEIRIKIWLTLLMLLVYRIGCYVPVPGIDASSISSMLGNTGDFLGILSMITGGSLAQATLFSLGILPFINAFIIMQLLTLVIPALERLSKEGEEGRNKLTQITRYFAIGLAVIQAIGIVVGMKGAISGVFTFEAGWDNPYITMAGIIIILVAGSMMCMWLSERITEYGIGNGTSLIIFVGILSTAGTTMAGAFKMVGEEWTYIWNILGFILIVVGIFFFIVTIDLSERRITVQYSKQIKGNKMYGGQTTYIPIRVNGSGVMPMIFASSLLTFPQMIMALFFPTSEAYAWYSQNMGSGTWVYYLFMVLLIVFFAYFYAQIQFNPDDVSRNIQQYGGFIPGIRAGKPTSDFLRKISNRITLFGAIFLALIALIPTFIFNAISGGTGNPFVSGPLGFGGAFSATGLLIVVSTALEFNKQLESQIMMKHYKGFLK
ncbi:MAG: preprotein translocase subunit SecY [Clostridia bacterium]|nr:preprotein translocase subunit SecY [Clostridia bacterium]MBO7221551.1 preprotein translocase subunit SecY [Clostridia bacterium]